MRYRLRTLLLLMAVGPPLIGFWPAIKQRAILRAAQINASDIAVVAAASSLIAIRVRLHRLGAGITTLDQQPMDRAGEDDREEPQA